MGNSSSKTQNPYSRDGVFIELDNRSCSFQPGQMVTGKIHVALDKLDAFLLRGINLNILGREDIGWTERHTHTTSDGKGNTRTYHTYSYPKEKHIFFDQSFAVANREQLRAGAYCTNNANNLQKNFTVPFCFQLPYQIPGSCAVSGLMASGDTYDGHAEVRYTIFAEVAVDLSAADIQANEDRSWIRKVFSDGKKDNNLRNEQVFQVTEPPRFALSACENNADLNISTCCFEKGRTAVNIWSEKNQYFFGDKIVAKCLLDNRNCKIDMSEASVRLKQIVYLDIPGSGKWLSYRKSFVSQDYLLKDENGKLFRQEDFKFSPSSGFACPKNQAVARKFELFLNGVNRNMPPSCLGSLIRIEYFLELKARYPNCCTTKPKCSVPLQLLPRQAPVMALQTTVSVDQQQAFMNAQPTTLFNDQVFYVAPNYGNKKLPPAFNPYARQMDCAICCEKVDVRQTGEWICNVCHRPERDPLHPKCVLDWVKSCEVDAATCPLCRAELSSVDVSSLYVQCGEKPPRIARMMRGS